MNELEELKVNMTVTFEHPKRGRIRGTIAAVNRTGFAFVREVRSTAKGNSIVRFHRVAVKSIHVIKGEKNAK